jgi:hypothetical protein
MQREKLYKLQRTVMERLDKKERIRLLPKIGMSQYQYGIEVLVLNGIGIDGYWYWLVLVLIGIGIEWYWY